MSIKKRGFHIKGNRAILQSAKSKIVFSFIVLIFGAVIALAALDIVGNLNSFDNDKSISFSPEEDYSIELDIPSYLPSYLANVTTFFSDRKIKITKTNGEEILLGEQNTVSLLTQELAFVRDLEITKRGNNFFNIYIKIYQPEIIN